MGSVVCMYVYMYLICQMQTTDKATTKQRTQWRLVHIKNANITSIFRIRTVPSALQSVNRP